MAMALARSWDVVLMRMDSSVNSIEVLSDCSESPLGTLAQVLFFLEGLLPEADFSDPTRFPPHPRLFPGI